MACAGSYSKCLRFFFSVTLYTPDINSNPYSSHKDFSHKAPVVHSAAHLVDSSSSDDDDDFHGNGNGNDNDCQTPQLHHQTVCHYYRHYRGALTNEMDGRDITEEDIVLV